MNATVLTDNELIAKYLDGNHQMLECLISRHQKKVFSYILIVVKDKAIAEDIFQDTFIKVINTIRSGFYKEEGKFIQWVMRIAHNLTIDHFRRAKRIPTIENKDEFNIFDTIKVYDESIEDKMITDQIHSDVRNLLEMLPDEQKEVIILRHYADMSFKDIAEHTNVSINTALGRMRYALINMRRMAKEKSIQLSA
ncbi:MAG: sigma-70 family RNA polymerase sigma factor [Bacteroidetes bacterium]|nr:sigma-70 family RNA polymerase sigma factor [Bacteroidota bacterium]